MEPYLSFVAAARNDNHGGDLLRRMQTFVTALLEQCARHAVPAELIVVEWNPPSDRPPLAEALEWPVSPGPCAVRVIEVPAALHRRLALAEQLPLYQMIAKNAGIRRARGRFVAATNIDVLFSDELMQFLAGQTLAADKMYRIDRHDVMKEVPAGAGVEEQLAYCKSHLLRLNAAGGTYSLTPGGALDLESNDIAPRGAVSLGPGWFAREMDRGRPFRWLDNGAEIEIGAGGVLVLDLEPGPGARTGALRVDVVGADGAPVFSRQIARRTVLNIPVSKAGRLRLHLDGGGRTIASDPRALNAKVYRCSLEITPAAAYKGGLLSKIRRPRAVERKDEAAAAFLHMTCCGDFTMLARERWFDLRGYAEFDAYSMNIDALFCWTAHHGGAREHILKEPMRLYHMEHETGSGWTPEGNAKLHARIAQNGVPWLDYADVIRWARDMNRFDLPLIFNREDWGLAALELKETRPLEGK